MIFSKNDPGWLPKAIAAVGSEGYAIITDVLDAAFLERSRRALYEARDRIATDIGPARLAASGEIGTLRLLFRYHPHFFDYLEIPELLALVDELISPTAILHTQNGLILPSFEAGNQPVVFQNSFHRDFPRYLNGYRASISVLFAIDAFNDTNGATLLAPGTHVREERSSDEETRRDTVVGICPAGAMLVFDAALWHAAGQNVSGSDRLAINHQFTRSWIKQQIDYVRAIGDVDIVRLPPRSRTLLGWDTRVVTSLDEYYRPPGERLYKSGQG